MAFPPITSDDKSRLQDLEVMLLKQSRDIEYLKERLYFVETNRIANHYDIPEFEAEEFVMDPPKRLTGAPGKRRPLLESEILEAQRHSPSARKAAKYLKADYRTYKKYAEMYGLHKICSSRKGTKTENMDVYNKGKYAVKKVLAGEIRHPKPDRLKHMLFKAKIKEKKCERCGWKESRNDGKLPLVLIFLDGDNDNQSLENMKVYCYNCTFVTRGYVRKGIDRIPGMK